MVEFELAAEGGKPEQAVGLYQGRRTIEYYARFIELWRECDPVLRPLVEQADSAPSLYFK